jgi:hypothetical protein
MTVFASFVGRSAYADLTYAFRSKGKHMTTSVAIIGAAFRPSGDAFSHARLRQALPHDIDSAIGISLERLRAVTLLDLDG